MDTNNPYSFSEAAIVFQSIITAKTGPWEIEKAEKLQQLRLEITVLNKVVVRITKKATYNISII